MPSTSQTEDAIITYRIEEFTKLGFRQSEAKTLAGSKEASGYPLDIHKVRRALAEGCTHVQAWRIFHSDA